jgi:hypothetical protein
MGAWGHGYLEDDSALDFMSELEESDDPKKLISDTLISAINSDYLESHEANSVIVSAIYVDSQTNGTKFSPDGKPFEVDTFGERHPGIDFSDLREKACSALNKVIGESSELNELWQENEDDYPSWKQGIEKLISRLKNKGSLRIV